MRAVERRNIGIFAHVDAGKTTLTEQMLLLGGAIRQAGSVDQGTAHTDSLPVEQRRGISVRSACVRLCWRDCEIQLIDTPGHVDFSAEIERALWALDGAVLVVSGADGVQPQTELLFHALREQGLPALLFVNKLDQPQADFDRTLRDIRRLLTDSAVPLKAQDAMTEAVCALDDGLMERYLSGEAIGDQEIRAALRRLTHEGKAWPVLGGSAMTGDGVAALLDAVVGFLPPPRPVDGLCGVVFSLTRDKTLGRGLWVRLWGGEMRNRDTIALPGRVDPLTGEAAVTEQKITQIRTVDGADRGVLRAGEIGLVYGLSGAKVGQALGRAELLPRHVRAGQLRTPLVRVQVTPENPEDMERLREACDELSAEDPLLEARYVRRVGEEHLRVMGTIQLEILEETLRTRFGLRVKFSPPAVIYRETIAKAAYGVAHYTMPKPCWAVLRFLIEPGERGSGVQFVSRVPVRDIMERYQHQVQQALPLALRQGRLGWEVTDVRITLAGGNHHLVHTHPLDFILATPWGIQDALRNGGSVLLEPVLEAKFLLPPECLGRVMSDTALMRGEVVHTENKGERVQLTCLLPAADSMNYPSELAALSGGRGAMSVQLHSWRPCPLEQGATAPRLGIDPLDTAQYILAARSALSGGIFDEETVI